MRQCLLVATASLLLSTQLHGQNPVTNAPTPTAASILEEAYQLSLSLNHPDDRAAVLSLLIGANGSVQSERLTDWAIELFNAADSTSAPDSAQESAMVALARVDAGRAVEFFRQQKVPSEKASEDTRTFSALALFPALWAREGKGSIMVMENLAAWEGSTGEYPYAAVGKVLPELAKIDPLLARNFFLEAAAYFAREKKFTDSGRTYVDFLTGLNGIPHDDAFRGAVAKAVEAIEKGNIESEQKPVQMRIQTAKNTQIFSSEREYLLYKLLPLIHELDANWYKRILESNPALAGRPLLSGDESMRFESGVSAKPSDSSASIREAWDSSQITRAVELSRTEPKAAFEVANAISTQHMRDIALASILPRYNEVDSGQSMATIGELQKHLDSLEASPAKLALEVRLAGALFELNRRAEAIGLSKKAMDLGVELFSLDRISHPGKLPFAAQGFDSLLDLAEVFGRRLSPVEAEQQILRVRDDSLKACMLAVFGRGLGEAERGEQHPKTQAS